MWWWGDKLDLVLANQTRILGLLRQLITQESEMAIDLTAITAEVSKNTDVTNSVIQLVQNLATEIANIPPSNDPATQAALDQLSATLANNDTAIAGAVTANTK